MSYTLKEYEIALRVYREYVIRNDGTGNYLALLSKQIAELSKPKPARYRCIKICFDFVEGAVLTPNDNEKWPLDKLPEYFELVEEEPAKEPITMQEVVRILEVIDRKGPSIGSFIKKIQTDHNL